MLVERKQMWLSLCNTIPKRFVKDMSWELFLSRTCLGNNSEEPKYVVTLLHAQYLLLFHTSCCKLLSHGIGHSQKTDSASVSHKDCCK